GGVDSPRHRYNLLRNLMGQVVYLDHNASSPPDPRAIDAAREAARSSFGNPASAHRMGRAARRAVEEARVEGARLIGASPSEIVFTSGGAESNALALKGVAAAEGRGGRLTLATCRQEHPSVLSAAEDLYARGAEVTWADDPSGLRGVEADLVSVML